MAFIALGLFNERNPAEEDPERIVLNTDFIVSMEDIWDTEDFVKTIIRMSDGNRYDVPVTIGFILDNIKNLQQIS